jgi:hypothetical protein
MSFENLIDGVNKSCLDTFGQTFIFTQAATEEEPNPTPQTITGILESGFEPEDRPPGDGSTYARLWMNAADLTTPAEKGDEVSSATFVYKIVRMEEDAGGGLWLMLRQDRAVS